MRGAEDADIEVYSLQSALGRAIAGARPGEQRTYSAPGGTELPVTLLHAVPYGMHTPLDTPRKSEGKLQMAIAHASGYRHRPTNG